MDNSNNKKINIKQVLIYIFFALIIILGIFTNNNYNENNVNTNTSVKTEISYSLENIPEYSDSPYVVINNNQPNFTDEDFLTNSFEYYSDLDEFGRCGFAFANLSK